MLDSLGVEQGSNASDVAMRAAVEWLHLEDQRELSEALGHDRQRGVLHRGCCSGIGWKTVVMSLERTTKLTREFSIGKWQKTLGGGRKMTEHFRRRELWGRKRYSIASYTFCARYSNNFWPKNMRV